MTSSSPARPGLGAVRGGRAVVLVSLASLLGCAHGFSSQSRGLSKASQAFAKEAENVATVASEEEYLDAKLVYQALPDGAQAQLGLRIKLLDYLLGPLATLDPERLRRTPAILGNDDDFDRLQDSFREALDLYAPTSLWVAGGPVLATRERQLMTGAAKLLVAAYSPRGNELPVATALFVLHSLEPTNAEWSSRLDQLFSWLDSGLQFSPGQQGPRRATTPTDILESVSVVWPTPEVLDRLAQLSFLRQNKVEGILRRPIGMGEGARGLLSELLIDTESLSAMSVATASNYLRCGQIAKAGQVAAQFAEKPGDDPEFRQLVAAASGRVAKAADYLALARRFLPRNALLNGTSSDRLDPLAALGVIGEGLATYPNDGEMLVLASRVARMLSEPLLSLRYLDEAIAAFAAKATGAETMRDLAAERLDLSFLRLKMHIDPDRMAQAEREAEQLRAELSQARKRFGATYFKLDDADIGYALAGGWVDAGQIDRAAPLLLSARRDGDPGVEVTRQLANLAIKRGDPQQAIALLRQAIDGRERSAPAEDTIPYVEGQAKLAFVLGNAYDVATNADEARKAWTVALRGWERLMLEQIRRKNLLSSTEATFEVGRLYYLIGRREEGLRKLDEAILQDEDRDQSYLDSIAFLVQRGESDAALDIFRRALARPERSVSEYVKVYASLWILDLTRRSAKAPDPGALAYLRTIAVRKVVLRPPRAAAWYAELARYATGSIDYPALLAKADTAGKRAEAYFYEAMRLLSNGQRDQAHDLWNKVVETKMLSFFEFEMASRYLRTGAPVRPEEVDKSQTI
jgi:tetratricopeptide (TPR) repeat protein